LWEFDEEGLIRERRAIINDAPISFDERHTLSSAKVVAKSVTLLPQRPLRRPLGWSSSNRSLLFDP
jgi:hypothetical protein